MSVVNRKEWFMLLFGDVLFSVISLWLTLLIRDAAVPTPDLLLFHLIPFSILFIFWILIFYIAGLYEKHTLILRNSLPHTLFNAQIINIVIAVVFFYFIPYFDITPKTILFIYIILSTALIFFWRLVVFRLLAPREKSSAVLIGIGKEADELFHEVNNNDFYPFRFQSRIEPSTGHYDISKDTDLIVVDMYNKDVISKYPELYNIIFSDVRVIDKYELYESIFNKVPISIMDHGWFLKNISNNTHTAYDFVKRVFDILSATALFVLSLLLYPFIYVAIKLDDGGAIFYLDERVGQGGVPFKVIKFRTMSRKDGGEAAVFGVGKILRKSRIDELPQLINVIRGDMSLIGPRPERVDLSKIYGTEMSFYNVKNIIKPGLSGWAQLRHDNHPHHGPDADATREKLSYDLYYIKNRSFWLDFKIALQTLKVILSQKGK